jgi:hypothetical protein
MGSLSLGAGSPGGLFTVAQHALEKFASRQPRHVIDEVDRPRALEGRDPFAAVADELLRELVRRTRGIRRTLGARCAERFLARHPDAADELRVASLA